MDSLNDWFGLKNGRNNYTLLISQDADVLFARDDLHHKVVGILNKSFRSSLPPKMVIYGDYGVGKTHLMLHIEHTFLTNSSYDAFPVYFELTSIHKKTDSILLLDVASHKNPWYWVDVTSFFNAMSSMDGENFRGYLIIN